MLAVTENLKKLKKFIRKKVMVFQTQNFFFGPNALITNVTVKCYL